MSECKVCGKECRGQTCSGSCRAKLSRQSQGKAHAHAQQAHEPEAHAPKRTASLEHYYANPNQYATRTNPEALNWGKPMSLNQLRAANIKANRVTIPGDWDYTTEQPPEQIP
jgi:hypothetical protein